MITLIAIVVGFFLDALLGDPRWMPHPVIAIGKSVEAIRQTVRPLFPETEQGQRRAGLVLWLIIAFGSLIVTAAILLVCYLIHPLLYLVVESWICYQLFATKELWRQSMAVYKELKQHNLEKARTLLGYIVGRDTKHLDQEGITKAAVETVAENTSDGVIAPLMYMALGGAPLGMMYKAVNTMDSMIGYKNETYRDFGRVAARADDAANFIPSRCAAVCMIAVAPLFGLSQKLALRIWRRDSRNHSSPNAAQTESVAAGALGIQLAGDAYYEGKLVSKPRIGDHGRAVEIQDIVRVNKLMVATSALALVLCCAVRYAILFALVRIGL